MNSTQMHKFCKKGVDDIINRMHILCEEGRDEDAQALYDEIKDWVIQDNNIEVISLEYLEDN